MAHRAETRPSADPDALPCQPRLRRGARSSRESCCEGGTAGEPFVEVRPADVGRRVPIEIVESRFEVAKAEPCWVRPRIKPARPLQRPTLPKPKAAPLRSLAQMSPQLRL